MRMLIAALIYELLVVPAWAQVRDRPSANPNTAIGQNAASDPGAVVFRGKVIARDPDPFIRNELSRHANSGWPD